MPQGHAVHHQFLAVGTGAALGSVLRWALTLTFSQLDAPLPLGTLVANCLGGFLVGVAIALFEHHDDLPPAVRLFYVTGFLGGLTTFSTFSGESVQALMGANPAAGFLEILLHLTGSLLLTAAGIALTSRWLNASRASR
ncbi:MAG: fluoride efflux transporter CrcB [Burkholderiales bacterium]|nr:fluoride efflux transporter CrcB [Ferrovum sp.]